MTAFRWMFSQVFLLSRTTRGRWRSLLQTTTDSHFLLSNFPQNPHAHPHRLLFTPICPSRLLVSTNIGLWGVQLFSFKHPNCLLSLKDLGTLFFIFSFKLYDGNAGRSWWRPVTDCISSGSGHDPHSSTLHPHTRTPTDPCPTSASTQPEWL